MKRECALHLVAVLDDVEIWFRASPEATYTVADHSATPRSSPMEFATEREARAVALAIFYRGVDARNRLACA